MDSQAWFKKQSQNIMQETATIVKGQNQFLYDMLKNELKMQFEAIHDRFEEMEKKEKKEAEMDEKINEMKAEFDEKINEMKKKIDEMNDEKKKMKSPIVSMDKMDKMDDENKNKELAKRASTSTPNKVCVLLNYF